MSIKHGWVRLVPVAPDGPFAVVKEAELGEEYYIADIELIERQFIEKIVRSMQKSGVVSDDIIDRVEQLCPIAALSLDLESGLQHLRFQPGPLKKASLVGLDFTSAAALTVLYFHSIITIVKPKPKPIPPTTRLELPRDSATETMEEIRSIHRMQSLPTIGVAAQSKWKDVKYRVQNFGPTKRGYYDVNTNLVVADMIRLSDIDTSYVQ